MALSLASRAVYLLDSDLDCLDWFMSPVKQKERPDLRPRSLALGTSGQTELASQGQGLDLGHQEGAEPLLLTERGRWSWFGRAIGGFRSTTGKAGGSIWGERRLLCVVESAAV